MSRWRGENRQKPIVILKCRSSREFSNSSEIPEVLPAFFKGSIVQSLQQVFGEIGGLSVPVDVLRFEQNEEEEEVSGSSSVQAILRVPSRDYFKLRSALCLVNQFQGHPCRFNVHCVSPVLLSLVRTEF